METREWALIAFTILTQMAVGSFVVLGIIHYFAVRACGVEEADKLSDRALLAIGPVLALGLLASLTHLGNPLRAYNAVANFATSWLSREILLTVAFFLVGGVFAIMQWRKISTFAVRNVIAIVAAVIGLVGVFAMGQIYMTKVAPAWNTIATPISFFTTTFLLGALAVGAAYVATYTYMERKPAKKRSALNDMLRSSLRWIAIAAVALLGIEFVVIPFYMAFLSGGGEAAAESARMMTNEFGALFVLRLVFAFVGAGILAFFLYQNAASQRQEKILANLAYSAFALVLVAEILGRFMFYATHVAIGV